MFLHPNSHPWRCLQVTARGRRGGLQGSWQSLRSLKGSGVWLEDTTRGKAAEVKFSDQHTECEKSGEFCVLEAVPQEQTAASHRLMNTPVAWEEREVTEGVELALVAAVATSREGDGGQGPPCPEAGPGGHAAGSGLAAFGPGRPLLLPASLAFKMHAALLSSLGFKSTIINKILPV